MKRAISDGTAIRVRTLGNEEPRRFEVVIEDREGTTRYEVTLSKSDFEHLAAGSATPEACVRAAFLFLLEREPRESILRRFDVSVISRYFPEFPGEFAKYLTR